MPKGPKSIHVEFPCGDWLCQAENRVAFIKKTSKTTKKDKAGVERTTEVTSGMVIRVRNIVLEHAPTGNAIKFPYVVRGGMGTFGDSRANDKSFSGLIKPRYNMQGMKGELVRIIRDESAAESLLNVIQSRG